jgi:hypothetical protein
MYKIKLNTAFSTNGYTESPSISVLLFTDEDLERIKHLQEIADKENDVSIRWHFDNFEVYDDEMNPFEWKSDYSCIIIYGNTNIDGGLYFYAQNKWDASDQYESECFTLDQIKQTTHESEI